MQTNMAALAADLQCRYDGFHQNKLDGLISEAEGHQMTNAQISEMLMEIYREIQKNPDDPFFETPENAQELNALNERYVQLRELYPELLNHQAKDEFGDLLNPLPENLTSCTKAELEDLALKFDQMKERVQNRTQHLTTDIQQTVHLAEAVLTILRKMVEAMIDHSKYISRKVGNN